MNMNTYMNTYMLLSHEFNWHSEHMYTCMYIYTYISYIYIYIHI